MKFAKGGSLIRLVAFFVIAAVLTCTATFAASGWQSFLPNEPDSDNAAGDMPDGEVDENTDGQDENKQEVIPPPEIKHYLTGITVSADKANAAPISFIYGACDPLYGISSAMMTVEIPTENGETRYISLFSPDIYLGKIGSVLPTRDYISSVTEALGSILIHRGTDDAFDYSDISHGGIDILENTGYSYTEYSEYHYTNSDLIGALITNTKTETVRPKVVTAPYIHAPSEVYGTATALSVIIPYSDSNTAQLVYNESEKAYVLYKGANPVTDLLNGRTCSYNNAFVLFASATTYETADATETVIDTAGGGEGYYFTRGTAQRITWTTDADGNLVFYNEVGGLLTVNTGSSYIAFEKASRKDTVIYS